MKRITCFIITILALAIKSHAQLPNDWRNNIPEPIFDQNKDLIELYEKAWEIAYSRVMIQEGLPQSPYMDEACWDSHIWIWDTAFMTLFTKYSPIIFPGVESLKNFYIPMHEDGANLPLRIQHPDNPPIFAWCEYNNYIFNGATSFGQDRSSILATIGYLIKHFEWFNNVVKGEAFGGKGTVLDQVVDERGEIKGYLWNGVASGMDNTVRGLEFGLENTLWIDAIAQQGLSALYIARLAKAVNDKKTAKIFFRKYEELKETINSLYWDEVDGAYYDIHKNSTINNRSFSKILTPASYWPLLAEMASPKQVQRMAEHLRDSNKLGGMVPVVTLSRDHPDFNAETGDYWRGGIWLPTTYMTVKALEKYGMHQLAADIASRTIDHMLKTYHNLEAKKYFNGEATIWECYNPNDPLPSTEHGRIARPEFCGWSALGPISLFIENVVGFYEIDGINNVVRWNIHHEEKHGLKRLKFGKVVCDIIYESGVVNVCSNEPFDLYVNNKKIKIKSGLQEIRINN